MQLTNQVKQSALLAELAYLKLENYHGSYTDSEALGKFIDDEAISGVDADRKEAIKSILNNYTIVDFKNIPTTISGLNDMQAMLLRDKEGNTVISFRGTEGLSDAAIDALMLTGVYTNQMNSAITWVKELQASGQLTGNVTITGHSLGGSLAQLVGYATGYETYTFNAFAIKRNDAIETLGNKSTDKRIGGRAKLLTFYT